MPRRDLKAIAPRWRALTNAINQLLVERGAVFRRQFDSLQVTWGAEMLAYNFAAAEAGVRHTLKNLQVRDVDRAPATRAAMDKFFMIHMGRAWLPRTYAPGAAWEHTEGRDMPQVRVRGRQVWCKCNKTGAQVLPWPVPAGTDFVSNVTLTLLHEARELYGPAPTS